MRLQRESNLADWPWLGQPGSRIRLRVTGYQFQNSRDLDCQDYDANWLMVEGTVDCPVGRWTFHDPCLLTWEAAELVEWLGKTPIPARAITFIEPLVAFERAGSESKPRLAVTLRGEALPSDLFDHETRWGVGLMIPLTYTVDELAKFTANLRTGYQQFPGADALQSAARTGTLDSTGNPPCTTRADSPATPRASTPRLNLVTGKWFEE